LSQDFASQIATWKLQPVSIDDWAWESHEQVVDTAYGKLSKPVPHETPQDVGHCSDKNHVSMRMKALNEKVGPNYRNAVRPVIEEQCAKAGTRLAMLLNQIWP
jgi:hypothetical protein